MNNSWICVDANLVIRLVIDPGDEQVSQLWARWDRERQALAAPTLLFYEVTNALYRYQKMDLISAESIQWALRAALSLPIQLYGEEKLHQEALALAARLNLPAAYDAHYLALGQRLNCQLWTGDRRLVQAVQDELPWVRLAV